MKTNKPLYDIIIKSIDDELAKTHDGTSMGTLRNNLKEFISEYGNDERRVEQVVSDDGKILKKKTQKVGWKNREKQLITDYDGSTDSHLIIKQSMGNVHNTLTWDGEDDYQFFEKKEMEQLLSQNKDGNDVFRSITKVHGYNDNNSSITIIKNNSFNPEKYQELCDKLPKGINEFEQEKFNYMINEQHKWGVEQGSNVGGTDAPAFPGYEEAFDKIAEKCDKKYGFVGDYVDSNFNDLIEESGVKLRFLKNDNI